ncbi:secreted protein [Microbacterium phage vB_MoxS-ISF9]|uniref:Lipoprotein n=1 Tax=Microbacterium phage vB_MoxS-ISF9 TaxID=1458670 RepID=W8NP19_9CAUD|nr:secreted protein [Microbacterium phage vB_MoxS-ISF9]AHL18569.1 hypothetical protein ISF9_099 [Microbacterium phage vB_MoxS-ISF9]
MKKKISAVLAGIAALVLALTGCGIQYGGDSSNCLVTDKYVKVESKSSAKMVASSCGVFTVEDELSQGNWNSADVYASIEVGKTYDFETYGYRNGFLGAFPNVNSATEVGVVTE